jgi:hypothetical protein
MLGSKINNSIISYYWTYSNTIYPANIYIKYYGGYNFEGSGQSWGLSQNYLNYINYTYKSSYCFVIKLISNLNSFNDNNELNIVIDPRSRWTMVNSPSGQGDGTLNFNITNYSKFSTGLFISINYDYLAKDININIIDYTTLTLIENYTKPFSNGYINSICPFIIYHNKETFTYYDGIYYTPISQKKNTPTDSVNAILTMCQSYFTSYINKI